MIDQFRPKTNKTEHDWPIWTQNWQIDPRSANFEPILTGRATICQIGPISAHFRAAQCLFRHSLVISALGWKTIRKILFRILAYLEFLPQLGSNQICVLEILGHRFCKLSNDLKRCSMHFISGLQSWENPGSKSKTGSRPKCHKELKKVRFFLRPQNRDNSYLVI